MLVKGMPKVKGRRGVSVDEGNFITRRRKVEKSTASPPIQPFLYKNKN
jgi:hypothetical protein